MPTSEGYLTVLDINHEINLRLRRKSTPEEIEKLEELKIIRYRRKQHNKEVGNTKRKITNKIKKTKDKNEIKFLKKEYKKLKSLPLEDIDNQANRILKKDFHFYVNDKFGDNYKIKVSDLMNKDNPQLFILEKFLRRLRKSIKKAKTEEQKEVLHKLEKNLLNNIEAAKTGTTKYETEEKGQYEQAYPIITEFFGDVIDVNF